MYQKPQYKKRKPPTKQQNIQPTQQYTAPITTAPQLPDNLIPEPNEIEFQAQLDLQVENLYQISYKGCKSEQDFQEFCRLRDDCKKKMYQKNRALQEWRRGETDMKELESIIEREGEKILETEKLIRIEMTADEMSKKGKQLKERLNDKEVKQAERNYLEVYLNLINQMLPYANQLNYMEQHITMLRNKQKAVKEDLDK
eukprot:TRINITY_DN2315_c0_g1_i5.p3 TRINITY_DN2315_c0_g1~~TRINITY_DN2315_c0_g1_i5.p3  ORF type:complete len:199 (+),score=21.07 TRINITY_DN2315_c0_g1_i5:1-597(+)